MSQALQQKNVAVAVIYDAASQKFLLWNNKRWNGYAFPMKKFDAAAGADPGHAALEALGDLDMPLNLAQATASPLDRLVEPLFSDGTHRLTVYDYHVYSVAPGQPLNTASLHPDFRYFTFNELIAAPNVTSSTIAIARSLVEDRKVALAVITRTGKSGTEFLLVSNKQGQYFFPAARMKVDGQPAHAVGDAVLVDLGYDGEVKVVRQSEVPAVQTSRRFGTRDVRFTFHPCLLQLPGVDLIVPGNNLEQSLNGMPAAQSATGSTATAKPYWGWFTAANLRAHSDMSPSVAPVLNTVLQLVG
jgi:hypothetical protein